MKDVQTREDLEIIMDSFYHKLLLDKSINYIFTDIAKINVELHLSVIVDFWEQTIFNFGGYRNNILQIHQDLNQKVKLTDTHFSIWLNYLNQTIDEFFCGENAEKIKTRALSIATVIKIKLT